MSELRHDPLTRRWVIISTERSLRPSDFQYQEGQAGQHFCPFCEGNEERTPPEIYAVRAQGTAANRPGWSVRVIPNKFPALMIEGQLDRRGLGIYDRMHGIGAHEVVIDSPQHELHMADMELGHLALVLRVYQDRLRDLLNDARFKYILIFKNHGHTAGATLSHPHSQIIATPVTPLLVASELTSSLEHHRLKERCLICDILAQEIESGERIAHIDEHFVAICPYASRFPFEIFFAPRRHNHSFADEPYEHLNNLARSFQALLRKLNGALGRPPFNFVLHTAPNTQTRPRRTHYWETIGFDYHWHIEVLPRISSVAGFEWGTGFYINTTAPEDAARFLREAPV